jgi:hypothetical protein
MENDDELVAIGDLHKKNITGMKSWNLRRFALVKTNLGNPFSFLSKIKITLSKSY